MVGTSCPIPFDGWGVVVSEALAAGVPVLASANTGAAVDLVRNNFNGRIVRDGDSWADAISAYCDVDRVVREGANGRVVGEEMAADRAAGWLEDLLLNSPRNERNFIEEGWARVKDRTA